MDSAYIERFRARVEFERERPEAPEGFPKFPMLPLGRYTDPAFFELEAQHLWKKSWVYAAHDTELEGVGAYKLVDIAGAAIILVRGEDGRVRGFYNACRHRGAPVVKGGCGVARMMICQYHSWGYDLQGDLVRVPDERDFVGLDRADLGLPPVRCENFGGWWFVNLDQGAVSLHEWLSPMTTVLAELGAAPMRHLKTDSVSIRCNWKIMAEGFLEVYHARTIHPSTVGGRLDVRGTVISLFDHGHQNMISPMLETAKTKGDGRENLPMWEGATELFWSTTCAHGLFPNLISPMDARGFPFLVFWPEAIDRTRLDIHWFAADWGGGPNPHQEIWDARFAGFDKVMDEDYQNLEPIQVSMEHAAHGGQVINYQERRIWHVHSWIDKVIGPERVPEPLRVPDILGDWIEKV